ncbi:hypothetical protein K458DRAFT_351727 [Lentithecium fluviatile CBS 122367]|uniref:Thioesterase domain-containing protein n=1 Tax=Lentithecium fluviatile CBS 122367 TaxID=1168545 RepID=A0A6G1IF01_9PLEO|nr:hypothetical protein K458DRAFT_351727 [Lentithecium fluviatile CBS 122367]
MERNDNPALIQKGDGTRTPLFLLHDAGGTVFSYYKLEAIGRPIYAIHNPWLKHEERWDGGAIKFVHEYIKMIKKIVSTGEILVGGWSLGGQLGIDIARVLAQDSLSKIRVVGIVMIDTLYPYWGPPETVHAEFPVDFVLKNCPPELKADVLRCMKWSKEDSDEWVARNWKPDSDKLQGIEADKPPHAVLLLATKYVPKDKTGGNARVMVDHMRDAKVGWDLFPHQFIAAVWEIPAHHFGLFEKDTIQITSNRVRMACDLLADD